MLGIGSHKKLLEIEKTRLLPRRVFLGHDFIQKYSIPGIFRLKDCLLDWSIETSEIHLLQEKSETTMKRRLTWWDLVWMRFRSIVGFGIFVIALGLSYCFPYFITQIHSWSTNRKRSFLLSWVELSDFVAVENLKLLYSLS